MITSIYSDVNIELNQQTDGDVEKNIELDAIHNSLANILSTRKGSRRMLPQFGTNLELLLFEPMDSLTSKKIGTTILSGIEAWEDRIVIDNINVNADYDNLQYNVDISYHIKNQGSNIIVVSFILRQI